MDVLLLPCCYCLGSVEVEAVAAARWRNGDDGDAYLEWYDQRKIQQNLDMT